MNENQIRELVNCLRQGDQNAFETLYEATKNSVYFLCISFLGNEEDAKDVMQDTYLTAYNYLYQLNDGGKFLPWINQIAVNKCKRILLQKRPDFSDIDEMENVHLEENDNFLPEDYIIQKEKRKIVMDIMRQTLSDIQYKTVILYYFNRLSIEEIANIMECPPGTVKYRLSIARGKIKKGVLAYENINDEKLYSVTIIPILTSIFYAEANEMSVPYVLPDVINMIMANSTSGNAAAYAAESMAGNAAESMAQNIAKTTGKVGMKMMKKSIIIGVASLAVVCAGVAAIVGINSKKDKDDATPDITTEYSQDISTQAIDDDEQEQDTAKTEFAGDWEKEEEYGYSPFWLKYANLSSYGKKDLSDIMIEEKFKMGDSVYDILSKDWKLYILYDGYERKLSEFNSYDELISYNGEIGLGYTMLQPKDYSCNCVEIYAYENEDESGAYVHLIIYNLTDNEVSIEQCINNNEYEIFENEAYSDIMLLNQNYETEDFRTWMNDVANLLGTPDLAYSRRNMNTDRADTEETFDETVEYGGGSILYSFIYDQGDYIVWVECSERNYYGTYEGYSRFSIVSKGVYDMHEAHGHPMYEPEYKFEIK